jgi:hypothetical protein
MHQSRPQSQRIVEHMIGASGVSSAGGQVLTVPASAKAGIPVLELHFQI